MFSGAFMRGWLLQSDAFTHLLFHGWVLDQIKSNRVIFTPVAREVRKIADRG
jgi:hypothetical protein